MYAICIICYNEKQQVHPERTFHRFPKNEKMKKKWLEAIGSHCSSTSGMICSDHFLPEDFCEPVGCGYVPKRFLQEHAVPKLKIIGLSMTEIRLQRDNLKEDVEQRVVVHSLDTSEKENIFCMSEGAENSLIKQPEINPFDFFAQSTEPLSFGNESIDVNCGNENINLNCINEYNPFNYDFENIPLIFGDELMPLNCNYENIPLDFSKENGANENITDPDLKRIISGNADVIEVNPECNETTVQINSPEKKKDDYLETKLKRVVIRMPDIGLRSFTEDDFTSTLAWKIFVKFILHSRKEHRALKHKTVRLQQKIESYQRMFDVLRKGGSIRVETKS